MTLLRRHSTPWDKSEGNGCGPRWQWVERLIPDLWFREACDEHDWNHQLGGGLLDKFATDLLFGYRIYTSGEGIAWHVRLWVAAVYTAGVLWGGWWLFPWAWQLVARDVLVLAGLGLLLWGLL